MREWHETITLRRSLSENARYLFRATFLLLLVVSRICLAQPSGDAANVKAEIARLEGRWMKAIEISDMNRLNSILADEFLRPAPAAGKFIAKSQLLKYYKCHPAKSLTAHKHVKNLRVTIYGEVAIARDSS